MRPGKAVAVSACGSGSLPNRSDGCPALAHFQRMIGACLAYARDRKAEGRPIVGIMCEFTPREIILAAGGVPVCLCGGSASTIPAAETQLPANLCPLIKSTFGYHVEGSNPLLEMADLLVAETTCDGKKKMYELLAESRPMYVLELPQKQNDPDGLAAWTRELRKFKTMLEERFNVVISDDDVRAAIGDMNRERSLRRRIAELMAAEAPPLTGRQVLHFKSSISAIPEDLAHYEAALDYYRAAAPLADARQRVRVLLTGVPMVHGAERVLSIIEEHGGLVVAQENCTGLKPILEDVDAEADDPLRALAEKYYHLPCSVMTKNDARLELLDELARQYRAQCVIELVWQACLTYDVESYRVRRLCESELELPYLRIETDYSPADSTRIAVRVEALFETVRAAGG